MSHDSTIRRTPLRTQRATRALARLAERGAEPSHFAAGFMHGACRWDQPGCPLASWTIGVEGIWGAAIVRMEEGFVTVHAYQGCALNEILADEELLVQWAIDVAPSVDAPGAVLCWIDRATFSDKERATLGVHREGAGEARSLLETDALTALCLTARGLRAPIAARLAC